MDTLQCAIVLAKLERLEWEIERRAAIGAKYTELLASTPGVQTPTVRKDRSCVYAQYTIQVDRREEFIRVLKAHGVPTAIHYPVPINEQPAYAHLSSPQRTSVSAQVAKRVVSVPMHPDMNEATQHAVVTAIGAAAYDVSRTTRLSESASS